MHAFTGNFWAAAAAKSLQLCLTLCDPKMAVHQALPSLGFSRQEHFGCHFLFQCVKVKSESEGAQSCPTLRDPMDCSPPGSSVHGILQARVPEWGSIAYVQSFHDLCNIHGKLRMESLSEEVPPPAGQSQY